MRQQPMWSRARAKDRQSKAAKYDRDNTIAASIILSSPEQHTAFQVSWAKAFQRRWQRREPTEEHGNGSKDN